MAKGKKEQTPMPDPEEKQEAVATVVEYEKKDKVAIVGFAGSTLEQAPVNDKSWEIWGLNQLWMSLPRWDMWFDLHPISHTRQVQHHLDWLMKQPQGKPIWMHSRYPTIPASVPFPKDQMLDLFGPYFTSTIAWMLAFAIAQKYPVIGIWGVDMLADSEYEYQRACCDYYIGLARGAGMEVIIPRDSALAKGQDLYGYDYIDPFDKRRLRRLNHRKRKLNEQRDKAYQDVLMLDGAIREAAEFTMAGHDDEWKGQRIEFLKKQREEALKGLYTVDGAIQELNSNMVYEKHYKRGGA